MKKNKNYIVWTRCAIVFLLFLSAALSSCSNDDLQAKNFSADVLKLTLSSTDMVLDQSMFQQKFSFKWSTGDNKGTGASISYKLEIDKKENNFANAVEYDFGKNRYDFDINVATLNSILLTTFNGEAGKAIALQARITATFGDKGVAPQTSVVDFNLTPYKPLSTELFMVGDASPNGWDITKASALTAQTANPVVFVYSGQLSKGKFKFAVNTDSCFCQDFYTKDGADAGKLVYNSGGSGSDLQWEITKAGLYKITVNILKLTIVIEEQSSPAFTQLWIVGDASPSGWNIDTPEAFTVTDNPFIFTYEATLIPGNFKILAGAKGNWCGEWFRPLVNNQVLTETGVAQNSGCDVDNSWQVTTQTAGRYKITLDISTNVIKITLVEVYLIGSATPNGWNMGSLLPMTKNGSVYTYSGPLTAGEFKFTKYNTNWCEGTEITAVSANQAITNTNFTIRDKCDGDDNKWVVSAAQAGNHTITLDLSTNVLTIN